MQDESPLPHVEIVLLDYSNLLRPVFGPTANGLALSLATEITCMASLLTVTDIGPMAKCTSRIAEATLLTRKSTGLPSYIKLIKASFS